MGQKENPPAAAEAQRIFYKQQQSDPQRRAGVDRDPRWRRGLKVCQQSPWLPCHPADTDQMKAKHLGCPVKFCVHVRVFTWALKQVIMQKHLLTAADTAGGFDVCRKD